MTRQQGTALVLHIVGGIACGAGVTAVLMALDGGGAQELTDAGWLFGIGLVAVYVAGLPTQERHDGEDK